MRAKVFSRSWRQYWLWHPLQALPMYVVFQLVSFLPIDMVSNAGGRIGRWIGPRIKRAHNRALRNTELVFPEKSLAEREAILRDMWDHLGRIAAEYMVLKKIARAGRVEIEGARNISAVYGKRPLILVSGHVGNWEVAPIVAKIYGMTVTGIYRPPNNRFVDRVVRDIRIACGMTLLPRGAATIRDAMGVLAQGGNLALLLDQRYISGPEFTLFGLPARSATTVGDMVIRFDALLMPVRVRRIRGARFRVHCEPPIEIERTGDRETDARRIVQAFNHRLEAWVRETPAQWLWPHRRFEDAGYDR